MCDVDYPLLVRRRRIKAQITADRQNRKACLCQHAAQLCVAVGTLRKIFAAAAVDAVLLRKEIERYIHNIVLAQKILPYAENMLIFHDKHIVGKNLAVLKNRVYVKNKQPSGVHIARNALKRLLYVAFVNQVIDTVQRTNARIDRFRQRERLHLLLHKEAHLPRCIFAWQG